MTINIDNLLPTNFPKKPKTQSISLIAHPLDLISSGRGYYTQIQFVKYIGPVGKFFNGGYQPSPTGGMILPLPKKINELQSVTWEPISLTSLGAAIAGSIFGNLTAAEKAAGGAAGVGTGLVMNQFLWMTFKSPNFKNHTLTWTLAANNEQESNNIAYIIRIFKREMSPSFEFGGAAYAYPSIAILKFFPNNFFTYIFKPCVVTGISIDYCGGGGPSFFKSGAPTIVNITVELKEIELWTKEDFPK